MKTIKEMTNDELLDEYDDARSAMSYYNAAEGNYSREAEARGKASSHLGEVRGELAKRNLRGRPGNYLC